MKPRFLSPLISEILTYKYCKLHEPFVYYSAILKCIIKVPAEFVNDYESVPGIRGTSKRGGVVHDYLCREDSKPVVSKKVAADVYSEAVKLSNQLRNKGKESIVMMFKRYGKYWTVRVAPGYFHKHSVLATYKEMSK